MSHKDDLSEQVKALTKVIDEQNKDIKARLEKIEKRVSSSSSSGGSILGTLIIAVLALFIGIALSGGEPKDRLAQSLVLAKSTFTEAYDYLTSMDASKCKTLTIYRYGVYKKYEGPFYRQCELSQDQLKAAANKLFPSPDNNISRLLSLTGRDLPNYLSLQNEPLTVVSLSAPDREHFMWPVVSIGHQSEVEVGEPGYFMKVKVTTLSPEPRVFQLDNLLTPEECDTFYQVAQQVQSSMTDSMVGSDSASSVKSLARSSKHTWIGSVKADGSGQWVTNDVIERVERRIFDLTRLTKDTAEPFQVVFYNISDYYYGHHDYTDAALAQSNPYFRGGGNRFITVLLYLNDVEEGGGTSFPFTDKNGKPMLRHLDPTALYSGSSACDADGLKVLPRKGGAAMFYSMQERGHMEGAVDKWSVHAGCKPVKGPKYISNKWIRNKRVDGHLYDSDW